MSKQNKSGNKPIIITLIISAVLIATLVLTLAFADRISGSVSMYRLKKGIEGSDTLLISAPTYSDEFPVGAEKKIDGERASELISEIYDIAENAKYDSVMNSEKGYWDTRLTFYRGNESCSLYLRENTVYIGNRNKAYVYKISDSSISQYAELLNQINNILSE
ncbi:MAG: hypothetical protein E7577_02035 [Ruminococcaceae bacterium]|nr:hypothetical protein [Oscillospiraceae bacterium]